MTSALTEPTGLLEASSTAVSVQSPGEDALAREPRLASVEDPLRAATGICIGIALAFVMWTAVTIVIFLALH